MKAIKRISLLAALPVIGLATSCNRTVSFMDAYEYVTKNYDQHMYDYVNSEYEVKVNKARLDGTATKLTTENKDTHNYNHNLSNFVFDIKDSPTVCITSEALTKIQYYYDNLFGIDTLSDVTGLKVNMKYYLNSGCLGVGASASFNDKLVGIGVAAFGIAQYMKVLPEYLASFSISPSSTGNGSINASISTDNHGYLKSASLKINANYSLGFGTWKGTSKSDYVFQSYVETTGSLNLDISMNARFY